MNPANAKRGEIRYQILHCCRDASSSDTVREIKYQILHVNVVDFIDHAPGDQEPSPLTAGPASVT